MKPTIEQIDKAIYWCQQGFHLEYDDEVMFALRVLKKLMDEPSEGMMLKDNNGYSELLFDMCRKDDYAGIFKAMRDQLLREVE